VLEDIPFGDYRNAKLKYWDDENFVLSSVYPYCDCRCCDVVQIGRLMGIFKSNTKAVTFLCVYYKTRLQHRENQTVNLKMTKTLI
jgi:hypothetical protein